MTRSTGATDAAVTFLLAALARGPVAVPEVRRRLARVGISDVAGVRARERLRVETVRLEDGTWAYSLPSDPADAA